MALISWNTPGSRRRRPRQNSKLSLPFELLWLLDLVPHTLSQPARLLASQKENSDSQKKRKKENTSSQKEKKSSKKSSEKQKKSSGKKKNSKENLRNSKDGKKERKRKDAKEKDKKGEDLQDSAQKKKKKNKKDRKSRDEARKRKDKKKRREVDPMEAYDVGNKLGESGFGIVFSGRVKASGKAVAIKKIDKSVRSKEYSRLGLLGERAGRPAPRSGVFATTLAPQYRPNH